MIQLFFVSLILAGVAPARIAVCCLPALVDENQLASAASQGFHQQAHAHKHYTHERPLLDALQGLAGFLDEVDSPVPQ